MKLGQSSPSSKLRIVPVTTPTANSASMTFDQRLAIVRWIGSPVRSHTPSSIKTEAANASGATPVVFIHGLWLLPSSWANWADFFKEAGYAPLTPDWPGDPETVAEARANPGVLAKKTLKQVADHTADIIGTLETKPVVMGHSTGGLVAEMLAGRGLSAATVAN